VFDASLHGGARPLSLALGSWYVFWAVGVRLLVMFVRRP